MVVVVVEGLGPRGGKVIVDAKKASGAKKCCQIRRGGREGGTKDGEDFSGGVGLSEKEGKEDDTEARLLRAMSFGEG